MDKTLKQFNKVMERCREVFLNKMKDYGSAWRILRTPSLTDQIYIKANRIRNIDTTGKKMIDEGITPEFTGIVNYSIMALIQLNLGSDAEPGAPESEIIRLYDDFAREAGDLMQNKNHDYGEAWRNMRISSLTDIILMKLLRIKQIEDNKGKTNFSEGIDSNYFDIINYAAFALIKLEEEKSGDE